MEQSPSHKLSPDDSGHVRIDPDHFISSEHGDGQLVMIRSRLQTCQQSTFVVIIQQPDWTMNLPILSFTNDDVVCSLMDHQSVLYTIIVVVEGGDTITVISDIDPS